MSSGSAGGGGPGRPLSLVAVGVRRLCGLPCTAEQLFKPLKFRPGTQLASVLQSGEITFPKITQKPPRTSRLPHGSQLFLILIQIADGGHVYSLDG